jgi:hypothetical protein
MNLHNTKINDQSQNISIPTIELNYNKTQQLFERMPQFELSYETIAHKKVFTSYDLALCIPNGKKFIAWFTFDGVSDVFYLIELNRDKKMGKIYQSHISFRDELSLGTILFGTLLDIQDNPEYGNTESNISKSSKYIISNSPITSDEIIKDKKCFVIEDIYHYKGVVVQHNLFKERLGYIDNFFKEVTSYFTKENTIIFTLPRIWKNESTEEDEIITQYEKDIKLHIIYPVHHIQIRKSGEIAPYLNIQLNGLLSKINKKETVIQTQGQQILSVPCQNSMSLTIDVPNFIMDFNKPQYRYPTVFKVMADIQYDIYHLFVYGRKKEQVYYDVMYIPNYKTSVFMNSLFRKIRENQNLDYIEESEDEEDFENVAQDKYVNLSKILNIECVFHNKFKKWVPVKVLDNYAKIVHISKLVKYW